MSLNLGKSDKNEQAPLSGSPLLKRWTRARERLALIKSQEHPWTSRNEPTPGRQLGFFEPGTDG